MKQLSFWLPIRSIAFLLVFIFLSFLPLTLILCWYYYRKRNPLPIMIGHALIDLATAVQIVATSFVPGLYQTMCGL